MFRSNIQKNKGVPLCKGGCQCGNIRYECASNPQELYVCHCIECRHQSASAFGITYVVPLSSFHLKSGTPHFWTRNTDSGKKLECAFCPKCGSRVWHSDISNTISLKGGSLDNPLDISKAVHIWTCRKLPGVIIPENAKQFVKEPDEPMIHGNLLENSKSLKEKNEPLPRSRL